MDIGWSHPTPPTEFCILTVHCAERSPAMLYSSGSDMDTTLDASHHASEPGDHSSIGTSVSLFVHRIPTVWAGPSPCSVRRDQKQRREWERRQNCRRSGRCCPGSVIHQASSADEVNSWTGPYDEAKRSNSPSSTFTQSRHTTAMCRQYRRHQPAMALPIVPTSKTNAGDASVHEKRGRLSRRSRRTMTRLITTEVWGSKVSVTVAVIEHLLFTHSESLS